MQNFDTKLQLQFAVSLLPDGQLSFNLLKLDST